MFSFEAPYSSQAHGSPHPADALPFACITRQALISTLLDLLNFSYLPLGTDFFMKLPVIP